MSTISSIAYDKRTGKYFVMMQDSRGSFIRSTKDFDTLKEAEDFLHSELKRVGGDPGVEIPVKRN